MNETNERTQDPPRRLERGNRPKIGGVCDGIANYFALDVTIVRILTVVGAFVTGGIILLAYLVSWAIMPPSSGQPNPPRSSRSSSERNVVIAWGLIVVGLLAVGSQVTWIGLSVAPLALIGGGVYLLTRTPKETVTTATSAPPPESATTPPAAAPSTSPLLTAEHTDQQTLTAEPDGSFPMTPLIVSLLSVGFGIGLLGHVNDWWTLSLAHVFSITLLASGAGLLVAAFTGRAPGLIVLGFVAILGLSGAWILDPMIQHGAGQRTKTVETLDELQANYSLGAGELILDLRDLDLQGTQQSVSAEVVAGSLTVFPPRGVDLTITASAVAGEVTIGQITEDGIRPELSVQIDKPGNARLIIDAEVTFGEVVVYR
jgi:phage shock protein PspC (stress-responsive transcriptional regulator)